MDTEEKYRKSSWSSRGKSATKRSISITKGSQPESFSTKSQDGSLHIDQSIFQEEKNADLSEALSSLTTHPKAFGNLLGFLLKNDRSEILRVAKEIGVSDNTVYRWIHGTSEPRPGHLQRLLEVLSQSQILTPIPNELPTVSGNGRSLVNSLGRWEVPKEIYRRVMEQASMTVDDASRHWHIIETIFEYILLHLDPDRQGLSVTYASLMPPRDDGYIHSLYEAEMRGQAPWPFSYDCKAYLGSNTLAGSAAILQRVQVWSCLDEDFRYTYMIDEHEHSSCAAPVMRAGRLAGVLIVSSRVPEFSHNVGIHRAVTEYAYLLAAGLLDHEFYPVSQVRLGPMPPLKWQREQIGSSYLNRVIECARKQCLSFPEAQSKVLRDLEKEFEQLAQLQEKERQTSQK